ncbi:MAG: sortase [Clostridia bacterium]|nr:sortase [Clostridia bacterium]
MKLKLYKIFFAILLILACITITFIVIKYHNSNLIEMENKEAIETFSREVAADNENEEIKMNGYKVIGIVKIPKIEIEYPILDIDTYNPEETKEPMKTSIVKYWGENVNDFGNLSIAGHNNYNGTMFGKAKYLEKGDIVQLTDLNNQTIKYAIDDIFVTDPNDITILQTTNKDVREVTLITCTNGNKQRLILKAKEVA